MKRDLDELTAVLRAWSDGDPAAEAKLLPLVYDQLRRQAAHQLRRERPGHSLSPTAVVHELYLRLVPQERASWVNRAQFFAVASRLIRRARLVELRYFGGLSLDETAAALGVSAATVSREWQLARAWLHRRLADAEPRET